MIRLVPLLFAVLVQARLAGAQEEPSPGPRADLPSTSAVQVLPYRPRHVDPGELFQVAQQLMRTELVLFDEESGVAVRRPNLQRLGDTLLLYDLPASLQRHVALLRQLDVAPESAERGDELVVHDYRPRFLSGDAIVESLQHRYRSTRGAPRISFVRERGVVVLQDTPEGIEEVRALLTRIDVPKPQLLLTAYLVAESADPESRPLPADLEQGLAALTGITELRMAAMGMVRTSVDLDQSLSLLLQPSRRGDSMELSLRLSAYDPATGTLTLSRCALVGGAGSGPNEGKTVFETSTVVKGGEYTVLGAAGADLLFAVLRATPVDG